MILDSDCAGARQGDLKGLKGFFKRMKIHITKMDAADASWRATGNLYTFPADLLQVVPEGQRRGFRGINLQPGFEVVLNGPGGWTSSHRTSEEKDVFSEGCRVLNLMSDNLSRRRENHLHAIFDGLSCIEDKNILSSLPDIDGQNSRRHRWPQGSFLQIIPLVFLSIETGPAIQALSRRRLKLFIDKN